MRTRLGPHQRMIDLNCRSDPLAPRGQVGPDDVQGEVLSGLQEMLDLAQSGELELEVVGEVGFAAVMAQDSLRLTLIVEISDLSQGLSPRELQIARLVAGGSTNHAIARSLDISTWTVSTHMRRIFAKLSVGTRAEMVAQLFGTPHLLSADGRVEDELRTNVKDVARRATPLSLDPPPP
jgi:DNA-binding CsgD family transcriptional regulator